MEPRRTQAPFAPGGPARARDPRPREGLPPQSPEAERAVLSACLRSPDALVESMQTLRPVDFYAPRHQAIFEALIQLSEQNQPCDVVTLADALEGEGQLEQVGGPAVLDALLHEGSSPANVVHHARIVRERAIKRALIDVSQETVSDAYQGTEDSDELLDKAQNELFQLAQRSEQRSFQELKDLANVTFQNIQKAYERGEEMSGVPSGFSDLDKLTGGFQDSDLIILAGRPSMGKTALALNLGFYAANRHKIPVGIFSLEMSSEQLVMRLISSEGGFDNHAIRTGRLKHTDWPRLTHILGEITNTPVFIDDTSGISILELRSKARQMAQRGVKMIIVDYLQLISSHGRVENRQQEISAISRSLKGLAKDLNIPVIVLSQLSRAVESRGGDHRPMLSDLRESGAIEQDADLVMFVYRQEYYEPDNESIQNLAEVIMGKQRNGPIGTVTLYFDRRFTRFQNYAGSAAQAQAEAGA